MSTELMWVGAEGFAAVFWESFQLRYSISFFAAGFFMNQCDVTSNNNVLTWRVNA